MSSLLNTPEVSVIGLGFVGGAMFKVLKKKEHVFLAMINIKKI